MIFRFDDCEVDTANFELRRAGEQCLIEPQAFDLLRYLIEHRDRVVTKEELLDAVWSGRVVSDSALSSRVKAARRAIGDNGRDQRLIRTIHGRGFRFVGILDGINQGRPGEAPALTEVLPPGGGEPIVGRQKELETLTAAAQEAGRGQGRLVFVGGEAGIGKTSLLRRFLDAASRQGLRRVAVGQCVEQRESVEPYLPLLDALGQLCQREASVIDRLRRHAPTWMLQLPSFLDDDVIAELHTRLIGSTRDRMLRELVDFLQDQSSEEPLVIVLEDLHWADASTLSFLNFLARRGLREKLLVIGTYRTAMAAQPGHRIDENVQELRARGLCTFLDLGPLDREQVSNYLGQRLHTGSPPADLVDLLYTISSGNPFFMGALTDWWISQDQVSELPGPSAQLASYGRQTKHMPPLLMKVIGAEFDRLDEGDQRILEWGAVAGVTFSATILAEASGTDEEETEARLLRLARRKAFVDQALDQALNAVVNDFAFVHSLYREAIYAALPAARRRRMHATLARTLRDVLRDRAEEKAAELADHCVAGGAAHDAVRWLYAAARQAAERGGHLEALASLRRAVTVINDARDVSLRDQWESLVEAAIAANIVATAGFAAPEAEASYLRAVSLADRLGNTELLSSFLYELATLYELRGEFDKTQELLRKRRSLPGTETGSAVVETAELMACSAFHKGHLKTAVGEADQGLSHYNPLHHGALMVESGRNLAVSCHAWAARALCFMGLPDTALQRIEQGLAVAERDAPFTLANAHEHAAYLRQHRLEGEQALYHAEQAILYAQAQNLPYRAATGAILKGWALSALGRHPSHFADMEAALAKCHELGMRLEVPYLRALSADVLLAARDPAAALDHLDQALAFLEGHRGYYYEAELHRLRGKALVLTDRKDLLQEARTSFEKAISIANRQSARLLELRAAISFVTLIGAKEMIRKTLRPIYRSFTEGFDIPDLKHAKELLDEAD